MAYFKDADEVYATIGKLFEDLAEDEELAPRFRKANTIVQYRYREPESVITVKLIEEEDGPYAKFNTAVAANTARVYEGSLSKLGAGPEAVARAIEKAITASRPKTRYPVTLSARVLLAQRALLPDRAWDRVVGTSFPRP